MERTQTSFGRKAQLGMSRLVGIAVALTVAGVIFAALLPTAINDLASASLDSGVDSSTQTLWDLLPLFLVLAALMVFVNLVD